MLSIRISFQRVYGTPSAGLNGMKKIFVGTDLFAHITSALLVLHLDSEEKALACVVSSYYKAFWIERVSAFQGVCRSNQRFSRAAGRTSSTSLTKSPAARTAPLPVVARCTAGKAAELFLQNVDGRHARTKAAATANGTTRLGQNGQDVRCFWWLFATICPVGR